MASYYKIINGERYDRKLLEFAKKLVTQTENGALDQEDAERIQYYASDGYGRTKTEEFTLQYISEIFPFTEEALTWFREQIKLSPITLQDRIRNKVRYEGLTGLEVVAENDEVNRQKALPDQKIDFMHALDRALLTIRNQEEGGETPRALVREVHQLYPKEESEGRSWAIEMALSGLLDRYLRSGILQLLSLFDTIDPEEDLDFNPPEEGENTRENWIFSLYLPTLSDHIYWAIIGRTAERKPYLYGFN